LIHDNDPVRLDWSGRMGLLQSKNRHGYGSEGAQPDDFD
jgi:hypothetical protein